VFLFFAVSKKWRRGDSNLPPKNHNPLSNHNLQQNQEAALAKNCPKDKVSPDLQQIITAWDSLPEFIKTAVLALINTHIESDKGK
jgi:hypothetical protein